MKEILDLLGSFGGTVLLAALFVWNYLNEKSKKTEENEKRIAENEKRDKEGNEKEIRVSMPCIELSSFLP